MTDAEVIAAIAGSHLKANIVRFENDPASVIHWDRAWLDPGGTIFGPGPYVKVPITTENDETIHRVYPPARLRRRLQRLWQRT